ncbi:MAG: hypothetical protein HYZ49_16855 [Chloroflexi bacterium]|nr:hypothetical protein [Chloroflexota bacterium]
MQLESLNCPNCNAPLTASAQQTLTICAYCNSNVRIARSGAAGSAASGQLTAQPASEETMAKVKQLLLDGRRAEAAHFYREQMNVTAPEAEEAVTGLYNVIVFDAIGTQPLSPVGWIFIALSILIGIGGAVLGWRLGATVSPPLGGVVALVVVAFAAFNLWVFGRGIPPSLLLAFGRPAEATVLKLSRIGERKLSKRAGPVQFVRLWLEVRPDQGTTYRVEMTRAVSAESMAKLQAGVVIAVKCDRDDPARVMPEVPVRIVSS